MTWLCVYSIYPHMQCSETRLWTVVEGFFFPHTFFFFQGLLYTVALLPRCLPPTTGSACQWRLSAGKHCLKVYKKKGGREGGDRGGERERMGSENICYLSIYLSICLSVCLSADLSVLKCARLCGFLWVKPLLAGQWVLPLLHQRREGGRGCREGRRRDIQAVDRDLWADSVRLQAQQQSPCLCLSARAGRDSDWQNESERGLAEGGGGSEGGRERKWGSKMSWQRKEREWGRDGWEIKRDNGMKFDLFSGVSPTSTRHDSFIPHTSAFLLSSSL